MSSASVGERRLTAEEVERVCALSAGELDQVFPFHFVLDRALRFVRLGPSARKLLAAEAEARFDTTLELVRPALECTLAGLQSGRNRLVLLRVRHSGIPLRGQFVARPQTDTVLFIGSPWFTDSNQIMSAGLGVGDFAQHDPVFDLLLLVDGERVANEDLHTLNRRLADKQARLAEANAQLQASEAEARKLALVASHTANAVIIADAEARVEWVNAGFTDITGYTLEEVRGRTPGSILQCEESDPQTIALMREHVRRGEGFEVEILNRHRDGSLYWVSVEVRPILDAEGRLEKFIAIESDITARKSAELRQEMQYAVARRLAEFGDVGDTISAIVRDICTTLGWRCGGLWQPDTSTEVLECTACWGADDERLAPFAKASHAMRFASGIGLPGRVWESGLPAYVSEVGADPNFPRATAAQAAGLAGGFAVPVRSAGVFIGVLEFFSRHPQLPDVALQRSLETVASQVGQFIIRRREEARAHRLTAELNAIFDLNPDAFVAFDANERLSYANPAFEAMTGVKRQRGQSLQDFDAALAAQCDQPARYKPAQAQGCDEIDEIVLARPRPRTLQRALRFIGGEQRLGRVLYLRDVTHEKEVERMKSEFLSTAAHELRTPMASIYGFTELLLARDYDERTRRDVLSTINRQAALLTRMVNELLDLARIEARAGRDFDIAPRALGPLLDQVLSSVPVGAQAERLVFEGLPRPLEILGDADKLVQAMTNLLSNAFKYSPDGGPVTVRVLEQEADSLPMVGVAFADCGIGMTPEQLAHATERFYRADTSGSIPGTGLGLSLVKEIVEIMEGRLELASTYGEGTAVTIWLRAA